MEPRDKESLKINTLEQVLIEKVEQLFRDLLEPRRARAFAAGELATPGNRLTAGQAGPCEDPAGGADDFLLRGGLNRKAAGHCVGRGAFERDGRRSWLN